MEESIKKVVEQYQCSGCVFGHNTSCFESNPNGGIGCGKHKAGTSAFFIGNFFLGMPKGFNRVGHNEKQVPRIYESFNDFPINARFDKYNIPVWKYLSSDGHTFVRGIRPRLNEPFLYVFLEDCRASIDCLEITQADVDYMD